MRIASFIILLLVLENFSAGLFAQKPVIKTRTVNQNAGPYFIYDTIQAGWVEAAPGKIPYPDKVIIDQKQNIYAPVKISAEKVNYCILQNGRWKRLEEEINSEVVRLFTDMQENVYALTSERKIYKKTGDQWKFVAGDSNTIYNLDVHADGIFYGYRKPAPGSKILEMVRWDGKKWINIYSKEGKLVFDDLPDLVIKKQGTMYFATSDKKKGSIVQCLIGDDIQEIGQMPDDIRGLGIDENGIVYAYGGYSKVFLKSWNGSVWNNVPFPAGISNYVEPTIDNRSGIINLSSVSKDSNEYRSYYVLKKGNWVKICSYHIRTTYPLVFSKGFTYAILRKSEIFSRLETGRIVKREVYPFSYKEGLTRISEVEEKINEFRLIKEGNKYGVINRKGEMIIYPAIDKIIIDTDPSITSYKNYVFSLLIQGVNYYTSIYNSTVDPFKLLVASQEKSDECKACKGKGILPGATQYETVQGDWVEGYSMSSTRPSTMGGYQKTTTNVPGYRKPSTQKSKGKAPDSRCNKCNGKGAFVKGWKEYLEYQAKTKTYLKRRVDFTN